MDEEEVQPNYIAGTPYVGMNVRMYPGPGGNWRRIYRVGRSERKGSLVYQGQIPFLEWSLSDRRRPGLLWNTRRMV